VAPLTVILLTPTSSLVTTVNVTVLFEESFWEANQVSCVELAEYEVIVGATLSVLVIFTLTEEVAVLPVVSLTLNVKVSVEEPNE
jgi:hypothetical protein